MKTPLRSLFLLAACGAAACVGNQVKRGKVEARRPQAPAVASAVASQLMLPMLPITGRDLADDLMLLQSEGARSRLRATFSEAELAYVGFDQLSLSDSVDRLMDAVDAVTRRPGDDQAAEAFRVNVALYLSVRRDVHVRRHVGRGNCLPRIR